MARRSRVAGRPLPGRTLARSEEMGDFHYLPIFPSR
jgi:hypothetical protein